ncbi:RNA polymerase sigma factor [Streptomyces sp. NPDC018031]|uniref:RNA polymerase sigma factor n=1 Tax=Streptomyces sp. NPDC018031 TaxID=3365033 RepID=UPI0037A6500A
MNLEWFEAATAAGTVSTVALSAARGEQGGGEQMAGAASEPPLDFQTFYKRYHRVYLRYAHLHLGDRSAAIETVETVFVQLLESWPKVLSEASVQRYTVSVLRHTIASRLAVTGRTSALVETAVFDRVRAAVRRQLEVMESSLGLYGAIARLPERQMDVIVFRFVLGYTPEQVAEIMGVSCGTVRSHTHAARRQLARELGMRCSNKEAEEIA